MTLRQIRERLKKRAKRKRRGWTLGSLFTVTDVQVKTGTVHVWERLDWWQRHVLMAYVNATETMQAWEDYKALPRSEQ